MNTSSQSSGSISSSENTESGNSQQPAPINLATVIELESPTERRIALYQLLGNKTGGQVEELLRQSLRLDYTKNLYSVQRLLFAELARIVPEKSLGLVWETARTRWKTLLNTVAIHWSSVAPEEALQTFSLLDEPWKSQAIKTVFHHQGQLSDDQIAEIAESFHFTAYLAAWNFDTQLEAVIDAPRTAYKLAIEANTSEFHKRSMFLDITNRWIERAGTDDISAMLSLAYEIVNESRGLWIPVVTAIAAMNPELAWEQLSSMPTDVQRQFKRYVFKVWVEHDPKTAIQTITTKEYVDAEGSDFYSLLIPWIRAEADRLLENLELVPENFKIPAINLAVDHLAKSSPPSEVIELLAQLKLQGHITDDATEEFVRIWSLDDPIAAFEAVLPSTYWKGRRSNVF